MAGHFTIDTDAARGLLHVRMSGFYSLDDVARYHAAVDAASDALARPPARQTMICDISEMRIQSQQVVAAFQGVMGDARYRERRVGFVVASTLARTQLMRTIGDRKVQTFTNAGDAEAWLFGSAVQAA